MRRRLRFRIAAQIECEQTSKRAVAAVCLAWSFYRLDRIRINVFAPNVIEISALFQK